ncbi:MAG: hypothetical protein ACF8TS_01940, partial [Maioricimonas sp. JB049]
MRPLSWLSTRAVAIALCLPVTAITAGDVTLPLVAPVRTLGTSTDAPQGGMMPSPQAGATPSDATLPGTRLPQYQLGHEHRELPTEEERSDARLRLILVLPEQPLLIDAAITLDGQPFRLARERRVQDAFEQAMKPRPPEPEASSDADSAAAPDPAGDGASNSTEAASTGADAAPPQGEHPEDAAEEAGSESGTADGADADLNEGVDDLEEGKEEEEEEEEEEGADQAVTPATVPPSSLANSLTERLRRHR